jgi:hypothetical protein
MTTTEHADDLRPGDGSPSGSALQGDEGAAEVERRYHHYTGNRIPWYIRLLWVCFWIFAISYVISYLFPALRGELTNPP